ncbi:MAG: L-lactate permease [Methylophilaceae bacterium]|nr:L-lactate permease [Methylophilaceae bacterium]
MIWQQAYNPFGNMIISTLLAFTPVAVMLVSLGFFHIKAHIAASLGLLASLLVAIFVYGMPLSMAGSAALYGGITGLMPIGWIVLNIIFLQQLTLQNGSFKILQASLTSITQDRRLQVLLIAFCFGAFFEGASGFGAPVAITAGTLLGLGFTPLAASGLSLIANTAPVAFAALGTPIISMATVHDYDLMSLTAMVGRQLPFFSVLIPFWLIWAFVGRKAMMEVWPAILVTGLSFAIPQFLVSNFIGPELVDIIAAIISMLSLIFFLRIWQPKKLWLSANLTGHDSSGGNQSTEPLVAFTRGELIRAWMPWLILMVVVFVFGLPSIKAWLNSIFSPSFEIPGLHNLVEKVPPAVVSPTKESAVYTFGFLSSTGTVILLAAIVSAIAMKYKLKEIVAIFGRTVWLVRYPLLTIFLMLGLGMVTRFSGGDTTLGLAFANGGMFYPFLGTLMGWMGVAMTGSDTASNVLFGGMQKIASNQLGLPENLMGAANSSGGVMGKMIDAQSIVVASTATGWVNHEGEILRFVFFNSIALASLVGIFVTLQAYVYPFTLMVVK